MSDTPAFNMSAVYTPGLAAPPWLIKGDNAWQMISVTLVMILPILYGSIVKRKWAVSSAFMALYVFAAAWLWWDIWAYNMPSRHVLLPFWGNAHPALGQGFLLEQTLLPQS